MAGLSEIQRGIILTCSKKIIQIRYAIGRYSGQFKGIIYQQNEHNPLNLRNGLGLQEQWPDFLKA